MKQKIKLLIVAIVVVLLISIFFPKSYVKGGLGGFIGPGDTAYKEEYNCFGLKHSYYPSGCSDCANVHNCYGIPYGKKCYIEEYDKIVSKEITVCK